MLFIKLTAVNYALKHAQQMKTAVLLGQESLLLSFERNNEKQVTALKASWNQFPEQLTALQNDALSMCKRNLKEYKCSKPIQVMSGEKDVSRWDIE